MMPTVKPAEALRHELTARRVVPVIGAGVSVQVAGLPSWRGAIDAALQHAVDTGTAGARERSDVDALIAAHDLVAKYVPPAESSVWAADRRELPEVEEPKQLVDLVRDDEFPLSLFYTQLGPKLEDAFAARPRRAEGEGRTAVPA